jgi:phosphoglycolate phosphatase-like HAD superfamily hydrolase
MDIYLAGSLQPIDLVVFDCDGVLLDSMGAKIQAFRDWVPVRYAHLREDFMSVIMDGFGKAREHHVKTFYSEIVGKPATPDRIEAEVARFTEICEPLCASAPWRLGSREFVEACIESGIPRYVLSGTPQKPLEDMLESTGGTPLFDVIIGSPPTKPESLELILRETQVGPERMIFVGDANADQEAALHVGAHFVYFPSEANAPLAPTPTVVNDLRELLVDRN